MCEDSPQAVSPELSYARCGLARAELPAAIRISIRNKVFIQLALSVLWGLADRATMSPTRMSEQGSARAEGLGGWTRLDFGVAPRAALYHSAHMGRLVSGQF